MGKLTARAITTIELACVGRDEEPCVALAVGRDQVKADVKHRPPYPACVIRRGMWNGEPERWAPTINSRKTPLWRSIPRPGDSSPLGDRSLLRLGRVMVALTACGRLRRGEARNRQPGEL